MGSAVSLCNTIGIQRQLTILCVGLDNAGKTCAARALVGETINNTTPTIGFSKHTTKLDGVVITIYDLGGGARIREIWNNYFAESHGVIYVLDSSDSKRLLEAQDILKALMTHPLVRGKPLLLLANKQDNDEAMDEVDVSESLHLEELANECQSPTRIEICSATQGSGKNMDPSIRIGFQWLVATILHNFDTIQHRVVDGMALQKAEEEVEREERKQRIRKTASSDDLSGNPAQDEERDASFKGNPFRPVNELIQSWNLPGAVFTDVENVTSHDDGIGTDDNLRNVSHMPCRNESNAEHEQIPVETNSLNRPKNCSLPPLKPALHELKTEISEIESFHVSDTSKSIFSRNNRTAPLNDDFRNPTSTNASADYIL